jgi:hypothetical protein
MSLDCGCDEYVPQEWNCIFCGNDEMWFDRTIAYLPDGTEIGMKDRCTQCGKATDELPEDVGC